MPTDLVDLSIDVKLFKGRGQGKVEECKHIFVVGWWILSHFLKEEEILCSKWLTNEMEISEIIRDQRSLGINIFCRIHTLCIPLWEDLSINLRPDKTSVTNFSTECLSDTEINSSTQKSNTICMNWWNNFTFDRKGTNINDFTFIYHHRPRFRGSKSHPSPISSNSTMV